MRTLVQGYNKFYNIDIDTSRRGSLLETNNTPVLQHEMARCNWDDETFVHV